MAHLGDIFEKDGSYFAKADTKEKGARYEMKGPLRSGSQAALQEPGPGSNDRSLNPKCRIYTYIGWRRVFSEAVGPISLNLLGGTKNWGTNPLKSAWWDP